MEERIPLAFNKILQTRAYTVIVLGARGKRFAIYTDPSIGKNLQLYLTGIPKARPLTHDLVYHIFNTVGLRVLQVVINDIQDTIYFARLFLEQQVGSYRHIIELDSRPSDALTLALIYHAPLYCTDTVLAAAVSVDEQEQEQQPKETL